ncbi:endonuclease III [Helicobacter didelphidarum]|uniref:Endonuclease III n=1 Tax=Helicobacter didelphidarum TaxID=2040648 RepID=A0A3D8IQ60_9HELI|nr:endonuclease III [Helicobacter didelphidarum]RDU67120.1 endonuclease III [Helicobacter didelphidarum]
MPTRYFTNQQISDGYDLLCALKPHYYVGDRNSWWWPQFLSLKIENGIEIHGALQQQPNVLFCFASILGQNTKYENAAHALKYLYTFLYNTLIQYPGINEMIMQDEKDFKNYPFPSLASISQPQFSNMILKTISNMDLSYLAGIIKQAGFHNQKAQRIVLLAKNILQDFCSFETFCLKVSKEWLLAQKGIGNESASNILNYGLKREEMVVDRYTQKLLISLGFECSDYAELQSFLCNNLEQAKQLYDFDISLAQIMARLHGKIVEYSKKHKTKC